jgi:hypothetical protein
MSRIDPMSRYCGVAGWELKGSLKKICFGPEYQAPWHYFKPFPYESFMWQGPCRPLLKLDDLAMIGKKEFMETVTFTAATVCLRLREPLNVRSAMFSGHAKPQRKS